MFWLDRKRPTSATPLPNTYWVEPQRLLAGEHPSGASETETRERIAALLSVGVTSFIDLTEEGEIADYASLLPDAAIRYRRAPVLDHSIPDSAAHMAHIVDAIEGELAAQQVVYLHCRAGIGRTGMSVACYLMRTGAGNEAALERLQTLWRQSARSRRWPSVPETEAQVQFVREWRDPTRSSEPAQSVPARFEGALVGLAVGEVLEDLNTRAQLPAAGVLPVGLAPAPPRVHTATVRAALDSLVERGAHDAADQMTRYVEWLRGAGQSAAPAEFKRAVAAWQWSRKPNAGSHDPKNLEPHALPRALAAAVFSYDSPQQAADLAADLSRTTHQGPIVLDLCRVWGAVLVDALHGESKSALVGARGAAAQALRTRALKPQVKALLEGRGGAQHDGDDAFGVTRGALEHFAATTTFREALLRATHARGAAAQTALLGALAGAYYGVEAIPLDWRRAVADEAGLRELARRAVN